jgi:histidinol phosphatase-like PHP family hydrolase
LKLPIVINSDAHHYFNIDFYFDEAKTLLKEIGYKEIDILENGKWRQIPIV